MDSLLNAVWILWGFGAFCSVVGVSLLAVIWAVIRFIDRLLWMPWWISALDGLVAVVSVGFLYFLVLSYI